MTEKQKLIVRRNAYKFYDNVVYENQDWSKRDIALASFVAGAEYALKNKYDKLKDDAEKNEKPNIVQFLKDNGVYGMFFRNLFNQKQGELLIQYFSYDLFDYGAISAAFTWTETPEGHNFWSEISDRFNRQF